MTARLAQLQEALARLVTEGALARVYERAPAEAIAAVAPDAGVREALAGLGVPDVARYARGLRRKRWEDLAATVPHSARVIGALSARYEAWLAAHPAVARDSVLPPGAAEGLRALAELTDGLSDDPGEAPWAAELLAFEVLAACSRADSVPRALEARHAVHAVIEELRAGLIPVDPPVDPHRYAFGAGGVRWRRAG
jgi:hypothetical protein